MSKKEKLTTASGRPFYEFEDSMSVGPRGPVLLQDQYLHEKLAHFNRERIPERVVHAKGSGAFGTFKVTNDISKYTKARLFSKVGNQCRVLARFSTVGGEKGSADTERDPRGFAIKFYTEDGNWDLVGNNTPVFFVKDPKKFPDFIHTQKRDPKTNLKSDTMQWDYWSLNPESLHQVMILFSDRGTPDGHRFMNGYGSHTFSMINAKNERIWVKFHFKTDQGNKTLTGQQADKIKGEDPDYSQRDLINSIENGNYPKWNLKIQVMTDEQAAFAPSNTVDGIGLSPDKMLQGRILAYPDAHRYRLGTNYEQIPVNRPIHPVHNYQRDGSMTVTDNGGSAPNYNPNSFDNIEADKAYKEPATHLESNIAGTFDRNENDDDHYTQPGALFREVMNDEQRENTVNNFVGSMKGIDGPKRNEIIERQLHHFYKADKELARRIAEKLNFSFTP